MDCKYAYLKSGYILCEKMGKTSETDPRKLAHKMCPFQVFCRSASCQKLNPNWKELCKLWKDEPKPVAKKTTAKKKATTSKE